MPGGFPLATGQLLRGAFIFSSSLGKLHDWRLCCSPGMLQSMGLQRVGHDSVTELNWKVEALSSPLWRILWLRPAACSWALWPSAHTGTAVELARWPLCAAGSTPAPDGWTRLGSKTVWFLQNTSGHCHSWEDITGYQEQRRGGAWMPLNTEWARDNGDPTVQQTPDQAFPK